MVRGQKRERVIEPGRRAQSIIARIRKTAERADGNVEALEWLAAMEDAVRETLVIAVGGCRARGFSDAEIGRALGITRQAVGQRFGRKQEVYTEPGEPQ
jgi:hypothetical protein